MCSCKNTGIEGHFCCHETKVETLGLVASHRRKIADGSKYDDLFPRANLLDKIVNPNGSVKYTVDQMEKVVTDYNWQTKKIAKLLEGKNLADTLEKVWNFFYTHYQYKLDKEGVEELRTPARAWHDGQILMRNPNTEDIAGIDCDCFAISVSCVLTNLNIKHKLRVTKYGAGWQHVYVVIPVPSNPGYNWIVDCVLDKFNIEKTYTDKFDHTMETLGIPVAILSGINDAEELQGITSGTDFEMSGFGGTSDPEAELGALRNHLIRTRNFIQKNPESVLVQGGARNNLTMLNHAIKHWDTPNRMAALTEIAQAEHDSNVEMGLASPSDFNPHDDFSGYDDDVMNGLDEMDGTDDLADQINGIGKTKGGKKFFQKVRKAAGNATARAKAGVKKAGAFAKKSLKAVVRYNPLTLAARGGFLLVMNKGLFDLAWAVAPGYFTAEEAAAKGISEDHRQRAIKALAKVKQIFVNTLQGKEENLKKAIMAGYTHSSKVKGRLGAIDYENLGGPTEAAAVTSAAVPVTSAASAVTAAGLKSKDGLSILKKVVAFFKKHKDKIKQGLTIAKNIKDKRAAKKAAKKGKGDGTDDGTDNPTDNGGGDNSKSETPAQNRSEDNVPDGQAPSNDEKSADDGESQVDKMADKMKKVSDVAEKVISDGSGDGSADNTDESTNGSKTPATGKEKSPTKTETTTEDTGQGFFAKAKTFVKENPGKTVAGVLITGTVITLAVSKKARTAVSNLFSKKKKPALSGVRRKRKKSATKRVSTKKHNYRSKSKVKHVRM